MVTLLVISQVRRSNRLSCEDCWNPSIVLDTHPGQEQDDAGFAFGRVSRFVVQRSFFKGQAPHRAPTGQNLLGSFLFPRAGPHLLSDVQLYTRDASGSRPHDSIPTRSLRAGISISKNGELSCQNKTKRTSVVYLTNFGTRAI